jgi:DNA-binding protein
MSQDNIIYIGRKPAMSYVMATLATFNNGDIVYLKARGRSITTAVDVAEITRNRYLTGMLRPEISIGTEKLEDERGPRNVSTMTIVLNKGDSEVPAGALRPRRREERPQRAPEPALKPAPEPVVKADVAISEISGVGPATEEKLKAAGYDTVAKVLGADAFGLALKIGLTEKKVQKVIDAAKEI